MSKKTTVVLGASENPERYSNKAIHKLRAHGHEVKAVGGRAGKVADVDIQTGKPAFADVDTVTLYVGPARQPDLYDYIISLAPQRVIFNPGTENEEFMQQLEAKGIDVVPACTLVMLSVGNY